MKSLLQKFLLLIIMLFLSISLFSCKDKNEEENLEFEQYVRVVNEISWNDVDPSLLVIGENIIFDASIKASDISFAGAFRYLDAYNIEIIDNTMILISTYGEIYSEDSVGFVIIDKDVNSTFKDLQLEVSIDKTNSTNERLNVGFWADLGLSLLKSIAVTAADKAFGYGLDKLLYDKLGIDITTLTTIKYAIRELSSKIDALSTQMSEMESRLTDIINESTKEILTNEYLNTFEGIHELVTRIKTETIDLWNDIASIESTADETSQEYRTLVTAELLTFSELEGRSVSPLVTDVAEAMSYIDGSYFSLNPESLYFRILKVGCTRTVFTGEAAYLVSNYLNTLNSIIGEALNAMAIVCQCKYYTYRQLNTTKANPEYKDVINFTDGKAVESKELICPLEELAETDEDLKIRLTSTLIAKYKDKANGSIWQNYLTQIKNNTKKLFDETNPDSTIYQYNNFVRDRFYSYNKSYKVLGEYVEVNFVDLRSMVSCNGSAECGLMGYLTWTDKNYKDKAKGVNDNINYYLKQAMTSEELDTFIQRLMSNESGLLFKDVTEEKTYTISDVLKLYGFSVPGEDNLPWYYATDSKNDYDNGKLTVSGYKTSSSVTVNRFGEIISSNVKSEDLVYYNYKKTDETRFDFYYFTEIALIYSLDEFVEFIQRVVDGNASLNVKLMVDLDLSSIDWSTIWPANKTDVEFRGTFDGNKHTISNMSYSGSGDFGLFRKVGKDAVVKNITFENVNINCPSSTNVGTLAGSVTGAATISNITVKNGTVVGGSNVGGIVGLSSYPNTMNSSTNYTNVTGKDYVGGLVGKSNGGGTEVFSSCKNYGEVNASSGSAGGIIGFVEGNITFKNTINEGKVTAYRNAGGLVSNTSYTFKATKSKNTADVTSKSLNAGGLIGFINGRNAITITECTNSGNITGVDSAGGFIGTYKNNGAIISNNIELSSNSGNVKAEKYAGGFIGYGYCFYILQIKDSNTSGNVTATTRSAGGLVGETANVLNFGIINSTITGAISGKSHTGNEIGYYDSSKSRIVIQ